MNLIGNENKNWVIRVFEGKDESYRERITKTKAEKFMASLQSKSMIAIEGFGTAKRQDVQVRQLTGFEDVVEKGNDDKNYDITIATFPDMSKTISWKGQEYVHNEYSVYEYKDGKSGRLLYTGYGFHDGNNHRIRKTLIK